MAHTVVYTNERGINVGIIEWRNRPLLVEQAILIYDALKKKYEFVVRLENNQTVKWWNGIKDSRSGIWMNRNLNIYNYEDGTEHLKEWVEE